MEDINRRKHRLKMKVKGGSHETFLTNSYQLLHCHFCHCTQLCLLDNRYKETLFWLAMLMIYQFIHRLQKWENLPSMQLATSFTWRQTSDNAEWQIWLPCFLWSERASFQCNTFLVHWKQPMSNQVLSWLFRAKEERNFPQQSSDPFYSRTTEKEAESRPSRQQPRARQPQTRPHSRLFQQQSRIWWL